MAALGTCTSSQRFSGLAGRASTSSKSFSAPLVAAQRRPAHLPQRSRACSVVVRADSNRSSGTDSVVRTVDTMLKRYDFVSTGMGALCVTGWFWSHGQPPLEALSIAAVSTIIALVMNELMFTTPKQ